MVGTFRTTLLNKQYWCLGGMGPQPASQILGLKEGSFLSGFLSVSSCFCQFQFTWVIGVVPRLKINIVLISKKRLLLLCSMVLLISNDIKKARKRTFLPVKIQDQVVSCQSTSKRKCKTTPKSFYRIKNTFLAIQRTLQLFPKTFASRIHSSLSRKYSPLPQIFASTKSPQSDTARAEKVVSRQDFARVNVLLISDALARLTPSAQVVHHAIHGILLEPHRRRLHHAQV